MGRVGIRSEWESRPVTVRIIVTVTLLGQLTSGFGGPWGFGVPWVVVTLVSLFLLKLFWDGSAGVWWLFTISNGSVFLFTAISTPETGNEWVALVAYGLAFGLFVAPSTRAWFNQRIEASAR